MSEIALVGVNKAFGTVIALDDVSIEVAEGELIALLGPSGCGKTTLLRIVAGLLAPQAGHVRVGGITLEDDRAGYARRLGLLSAGSAALYDRLSARGHLRFAAGIGLVAAARRAGLIDGAIEEFELGAFSGRRVDRLSMGQRQRLRLALAFLHEPDLILLDEPRTSLDPDGVAILTGAVQRHLAAGRAVVWCGPTGESVDLPSARRLRLTGGRLAAA